MVIDKFRERYWVLSNFSMTPVRYEGYEYRCAEAAFQAQKSHDPDYKKKMTELRPECAKTLGRNVALREDWEGIKDRLMHEIVRAKFEQNADAREVLLSTGDATLIEGNWWGDDYWGKCTDKGLNRLGEILEMVREELRDEYSV